MTKTTVSHNVRLFFILAFFLCGKLVLMLFTKSMPAASVSNNIRPGPEVSANFDSGVYYSGFYWNNIKEVVNHQNKLITGDENIDWMLFLLKHHEMKPFNHALFVGSGNGWVERMLHDKGVVLSGVGVDFMGSFVKEAQQRADELNLDFTYSQHDINKREPLPDGPFDLIVNHAAAHHFGHIDFAFKEMARVLKRGGIYAHMDYIGPHRNQYRPQTWSKIREENSKLPPSIQAELSYAHGR